MKKLQKINLLVIVALMATMIVSSCGKYEEGPSISLRTKMSRITGDWRETMVNDSTITPQATTNYDKDGNVVVTFDAGGEIDGKWAFTDDKEGVIHTITIQGVEYKDTVTIMRLTNSEFWYKNDDNDVYKAEKQ